MGSRSVEITVVSMLSNNAQIWSQGPVDVLPKTGEKMVLNKGIYMDKGAKFTDRVRAEIANDGFLCGHTEGKQVRKSHKDDHQLKRTR